MRFPIHLTKALVLVGMLFFFGILLFNQRIQHTRLEIFRQYSLLTLPPAYEVKQNTAGAGNYKTNAVLAFQFDQKNYEAFLRQNKINSAAFKGSAPDGWIKSKDILLRNQTVDAHTTITEAINTKEKMLKFHFRQE